MLRALLTLSVVWMFVSAAAYVSSSFELPILSPIGVEATPLLTSIEVGHGFLSMALNLGVSFASAWLTYLVGMFALFWVPWNRMCNRVFRRAALELQYRGINFLVDWIDPLSPWFAILCFVGIGYATLHLVKHARRYLVSAGAYFRMRQQLGDADPLAPFTLDASDVRIVASDCESGIGLDLRIDGQHVRVSLTPAQAVAVVASSIPQNQSRGKEMAIPGKIPRPVVEMPPGIVSLRVGAMVFGMGCRVSFNGKTYLLTATHVLNGAKDSVMVIEHKGKCLPFERNFRVAFRSKAEDLDLTLIDVPASVWSVLGVKALEIGAVNTFITRSVCVFGYSKLGKLQVDYGDCVARKDRLFTLQHTCYTQPSYSGAPLISQGRVIGVHLGATPIGAPSNQATSLALLLAFSNRKKKETPHPEGAWSELSEEEFDRVEAQNDRAAELEAQFEIEHQLDEDSDVEVVNIRHRGNEYALDEQRLAARGVKPWADYEDDEADENIPESVWREAAEKEQQRMSTPRASVALAAPPPSPVARRRLVGLPPPPPPIGGAVHVSKESGYVELIAKVQKKLAADHADTLMKENLSRDAWMRPMSEPLIPLPPPPKVRVEPISVLPPPPVIKTHVVLREASDRVPLPPFPVAPKTVVNRGSLVLPMPPAPLNLQGPASGVGGSQTSKSSVTSAIMFGSMIVPRVPSPVCALPLSEHAADASQEADVKRKRRRQRKPRN